MGRTSFGPNRFGLMVGGSGLGALSGYAFNVVIERQLGLENFGAVHDVISMIFATTLPAMLVSLAVARWVRSSKTSKKSILVFEIGAVILGVLSALAYVVLNRYFLPPNVVVLGQWGWPGMMVAIPSYANAVTYGWLLGEGAYLRASSLLPLPNVLKLICVVALFSWLHPSNPVEPIWALSISVWGTWSIGVVLIMSLGFTKSPKRVPIKSQIWSTAMVVLAVNAWLGIDQAVVGMVMPMAQLGLWATIAVVGRVPYHLMSNVANTTVMAGELSNRTGAIFFLVIVSFCLIGIVDWTGPFIVKSLMGVAIPRMGLLFYLLSNFALLISYVFGNKISEKGNNGWWPIILGLMVWGVTTLMFHKTLYTNLELFFVFSVAAAGTVVVISRNSVFGSPLDVSNKTEG